MAKRRVRPNWETVEKLVRIATRVAGLIVLIRKIL
jgi:hypothetical protein